MPLPPFMARERRAMGWRMDGDAAPSKRAAAWRRVRVRTVAAHRVQRNTVNLLAPLVAAVTAGLELPLRMHARKKRPMRRNMSEMGYNTLFLNVLFWPIAILKRSPISSPLRRFAGLGRMKRGSGFAVLRIARPLLWGVAIAVANSPAVALDINAGQAVYEEHCANCHGADGMPTMLGTPDLSRGESLDVTDADLVRSIKAGRNLMPAYDTLIKDEDILNVISYMRTLRR